jgi:hypothetical protein
VPPSPLSRRRFLGSLPGVCLLLAAAAGPARAAPAKHPDPRPGIDASRVTAREHLGEHPEAIPVYDLVREIPQVVDGIRCHCGCAELEGMYSLLSCYEGEGMAHMCQVCQGEARLAHRLHRQGRTLDEIRAAVDAEFAGR